MSKNWPEGCRSKFLIELSNSLRKRSKAFGAWGSDIESKVELEKDGGNEYERVDIIFWPVSSSTPALSVSFWEDKYFVLESRGTSKKENWKNIYRIEGKVQESDCSRIAELLLESIPATMYGSLERVKECWERI